MKYVHLTTINVDVLVGYIAASLYWQYPNQANQKTLDYKVVVIRGKYE